MVSVEVGPFEDAAQFLKIPDALHMANADGMSQQYDIAYPAWSVIDGKYNPRDLAELCEYLSARNLLSDEDRAGWAEEIDNLLKSEAEMAAEDERHLQSPAPGMGV
jgi:hypothetical protein